MKRYNMPCTRARCGKIFKHFLGQGPEAPRFTRAGRARARAKYPEIFTRFCLLYSVFYFSCRFPPPRDPQSLRRPIWQNIAC